MDVLGTHYVPGKSIVKQADLQDLKKYFARPRLINRGTITLGTRGQVLELWCSRPQLFNTFFPSGSTRLAGVYGVRFKMHFRLQLATTPFHQGLLAMAFQYGYASGQAPANNQFNRLLIPAAATNLPHVRLDLSETTMCELSVPFLYPREFMTLDEDWATNNFCTLGSIGVSTLVPVPAVAGITAPTYELYLTLEDMEFFGAIPQSISTITPQAGGNMKRSAIVEEQESDARPLSSAAGAASRSLRYLAKGVPMISSIADTAAWFLDGVHGALRAWGYSKPQIKDPITRMNMISSACENNVDIPSATVMCAPFASNTLTASGELGASDVDEMALAYVLSQWSQLTVATFSTALTHSSPIWAMNITPSNMWFRIASAAPFGNIEIPQVSGATTNSFFPSHQLYWASHFRLWRGGFRFRFTFVKTKHHGGRVMVAYIPQVSLQYNNPVATGTVDGPEISTGIMQPFGVTAIYDLRDNNTFTFDVPYTANIPFLGFYDTMGGISISVMDPLQAPTVVSQSISVLVEVQCLPDFELAEPAPSPYFVHEQGTIRAQSGGPMAHTDALNTTIDGTACKHTIGEKIQSIKQLIMIPSWDTFTVATASVFNARLMPWFYVQRVTNTSPLPTTTTVVESFHPRHYAACAFVYACGGQDVHVYHDRSDGMLVFGKHSRTDAWGGSPALVTNTQASSFRSNTASNLIACARNAITHIRFPAYQTMVRVPTWAYSSATWGLKANPLGTIGATAYHYMGPIMTINNGSGSTANVVVGRCAADDARVAHYIGPVPLGLVQATNSVAIDQSLAISNL